jgi:putative addiction module component (TIGR02574 family)
MSSTANWVLLAEANTMIESVPMKPIRLSDVLELPIDERLKLVEAIWDSIAEVPEAVELTEEQRAELDRRLAELRRTLRPDRRGPR